MVVYEIDFIGFDAVVGQLHRGGVHGSPGETSDAYVHHGGDTALGHNDKHILHTCVFKLLKDEGNIIGTLHLFSGGKLHVVALAELALKCAVFAVGLVQSGTCVGVEEGSVSPL